MTLQCLKEGALRQVLVTAMRIGEQDVRFVTTEEELKKYRKSQGEDCSGSDRDKKVGLSIFGQNDHTSTI